MSESILASNIRVTGSSVIYLPNFTGIGGAQVIRSGQTILISGGAGGSSAGVSSIDGLIGAVIATGTGSVSTFVINGQLYISGSASAGVVSSLNGLNNSVNIVGTGGISVTTQGQNILISGDPSISGALTQTGVQLGAKIDSLSGYSNATFYPLATNPSGYLTNLSGLSTGFVAQVSGVLQSGIAATGQAAWISANGAANTLSGLLTLSGQTLLTAIANTGQAAWISANGASSTQSGNLTLTGQTLYNLINSLSGVGDTFFVHRTGNENISGRKAFISPVSIGATGATGTSSYDLYIESSGPKIFLYSSSPNSSQRGWVVQTRTSPTTGLQIAPSDDAGSALTQGWNIDRNGNVGIGINNPSDRLTVSGGNFRVDGGAIFANSGIFLAASSSPSGGISLGGGEVLLYRFSSQSWAFDTNGANLQQNWRANGTDYGTVTNNGNDFRISASRGALVFRTNGVTLAGALGADQNASFYSGLWFKTTGDYITLSGAVSLNQLLQVSGALSLQDTLSGQILYNLITSLSGLDDAFFVHKTGIESISGIKTFQSELRFNSGLKTPVQFFGQSNYSILSGAYTVIGTGNLSNVTGILPSPTDYSGVLLQVINGGSTSLQLSGVIGPDTNPILAPWDAYELYATSGQWWPIRQTGSPLLAVITALSGYTNALVAATGQAAWISANGAANTLSGNATLTGQTLLNAIANTGQAAWISANGAAGNLSGNLTQSGISLLAAIVATGTAAVVHANGIGSIISGNLTQTGVALGTIINNFSGYADQLFVHRTGAELISGNKTFIVVQSGIRFDNPTSTRPYIEIAGSGTTGYWGAAGNNYFHVNYQTGQADSIFWVAKNNNGGQQTNGDGTYVLIRAYSGDAAVADPKPYDFFLGYNTGFNYGYIDVVHEFVGYAPLVLLPNNQSNVGIGDTNPQSRLSVSGDIRTNNGVFLSGGTDITNFYYPRNSNPSGFSPSINRQSALQYAGNYSWAIPASGITGNGVWLCIWSGGGGVTNNFRAQIQTFSPAYNNNATTTELWGSAVPYQGSTVNTLTAIPQASYGGGNSNVSLAKVLQHDSSSIANSLWVQMATVGTGAVNSPITVYYSDNNNLTGIYATYVEPTDSTNVKKVYFNQGLNTSMKLSDGITIGNNNQIFSTASGLLSIGRDGVEYIRISNGGNIIGPIPDNGILGWDATAGDPRLALFKQAGSAPRMMYSSGSSFVISRTNSTVLNSASTFVDKFTIDTDGNFYSGSASTANNFPNLFYPRNSNPSGYISSAPTGLYTGATINFDFRSNLLVPSGNSNPFFQFSQNFAIAPSVLIQLNNNSGNSTLSYYTSGISVSGFNVVFSTAPANNNYSVAYWATTGTGFTMLGGSVTAPKHSYVLVTGNFNFANGVDRYLWSGSATGLSGVASNWSTGTLPDPSTASGLDFTVKNIQTGNLLTLSGVIDFSQNFVVGPLQSITLGSNGLSWFVF